MQYPRNITCMGWLRLVGSLKSLVSFAKEPYKRDNIPQKRPTILRSLLIVATPQFNSVQLSIQYHIHTVLMHLSDYISTISIQYSKKIQKIIYFAYQTEIADLFFIQSYNTLATIRLYSYNIHTPSTQYSYKTILVLHTTL